MNLRSASLTGANLIGANLIDADLTGATMVRAKIAEAKLDGARLVQVITQNVELAPQTPLAGANLKATNVEDADGGVSIRIHVECAHCGQPQYASRAQQGHFATCKHCEQPFYLDSAGKSRTSKPVAEMDWTPEVSKEPNPNNPDWEWPDKWTRAAWIAGVTVLTLPGLWLLVSLVLPFFQPPDDLEGRGRYLAEAVVADNPRRVLAVSQPGKDEAARQWLRDTRTGDWVEHIENGGEVEVEPSIVFENRATGYARVNIELRAVQSDDFAESTLPTGRFTTIWLLDDKDQWMLAPRYMLSSNEE